MLIAVAQIHDPSPVAANDPRVGHLRAVRRHLPPILVQWQNGGWRLLDGRHRLALARGAGAKEIERVVIAPIGPAKPAGDPLDVLD